jgi:peptide/nickel transport system ATP-binding protein
MLQIDGLDVRYTTAHGTVHALDDVTFDIAAGGALGLVGESGSGKSTVALALLDLLGPEAKLSARKFNFEGEDLLDPGPAHRQRLRGDRIAMVFQDPSQALNPAVPVGRQIAEPLVRHRGLSRAAALERAVELLAEVGLSQPREIARAYPHQLSGGMKQRALIAAALGCQPRLLVLDEPTTALDVTIEAQILDMLEDLRSRLGIALLFVSHNLGVVKRLCDEVAVLYAGRLVEHAPASALFADPRHPYTRGLLGSLPHPGGRRARLMPIPGEFPDLTKAVSGCIFAPRCSDAEARCAAPQLAIDLGGRTARCWRATAPLTSTVVPLPQQPVDEPVGGAPLLHAASISKVFRLGGAFARNKARVNAVDHVSLDIMPREVLGLVGESGCGKSTLGRCLLRLVEPERGAAVELLGSDLLTARGVKLRQLRKDAQLVFQNPDSSLNPRKTVRQIVRRSLVLHGIAHGKAADRRVDELLSLVRLPTPYADRYPHQLSGGEKQRVSIARALATEPKLIVLDEATSALDVSVQAAILNLLGDLRDELGLAYLLISHDLAVIAHLADRVAVMYRGAIVEMGPTERVLRPPYHPYTEALLSAVPTLDEIGPSDRIRLAGSLVGDAPAGCRFNDRCPRSLGPLCATQPPVATTGTNHTIHCHIPIDALTSLPATSLPATSLPATSLPASPLAHTPVDSVELAGAPLGR